MSFSVVSTCRGSFWTSGVADEQCFGEHNAPAGPNWSISCRGSRSQRWRRGKWWLELVSSGLCSRLDVCAPINPSSCGSSLGQWDLARRSA